MVPVESIAEPEFPPAMVVRPLPMEEGLRRIQERRKLAMMQQAPPGSTEGEAEKYAREVREADVTEAARRSQKEIRRHVDAYLKEHLETIVSDVMNHVAAQIGERVAHGIAAIQEEQAISLDRIAADARAKFRAFVRAAYGPQPTKQARRAKPARRAKKS